MRRLLIIFIGLFLLGCANPYKKYYFDLTGGIDITKEPKIIPLAEGEEPKIMRGNDVDKDPQIMLEQGYIPIGYSYFNAARAGESGLIAQAKEKHASVVLVYSKYTHTVSGWSPLILPDTKTSYTSLSGSSFSSGGGTTNLFGTAQTTTYGTQVISVPYNANRYDFAAVYFVKKKPGVLGVYPKELTPELRQKIGSNKGILVFAVRKDSPAFRADILAGDIIKKIGDQEITDLMSTEVAAKKYAGHKVSILIIRSGKEITKEVQLNPYPK